MSPSSRKYKRIEALFSDAQPVVPDSPLRAGAKMPAAMPPVGDRKEQAEESRGQQPAEDTRPALGFPPAAESSADGRRDFLGGFDCGPSMGFSYDQGKVTSLKDSPLPPLENALSVPLMVSGSTIGIIQTAGNEAGWTVQEIEIVSAVASQLARHLKKLRPIEQKKKNTFK